MLLILDEVDGLDDARDAGAALTGRVEGCAAACGGACAGQGVCCGLEAGAQSQAHG